MTHFICTGGCKGLSDHSGTCGANSCALFGEALEQCDCTDGLHNGAFEEVVSDLEDDV